MIGRIHSPVNSSGSGASCFGKLLTIDSVSLTGLLTLSISSCESFRRYVFQQIGQCHISYQFYGNRVAHNILLLVF